MSQNMKINYHNEDYKSNIFNIIVYILLIAFIICWWLLNGKSFEAGVIIFCSISILIIFVLLCFSINKYKKQRNQRNLNLFIIKQGTCIRGKIVKIYDYCVQRNNIDSKVIHDVIAEIEYEEDGNKNTIVVNNLVLNASKLEQYNNKFVSIYFYNNMNYVDVINN